MADGEGPAGSSEERTVSYQPEERYWTDYLRIALPVIGLLLLIGLLWYWASALIGDGGGNQPPPTVETAAVITRINEATPAPPTATAVVIAPTPGPPAAPTATAAPAVATTQAVTPTPAAAAADAANPCASLPVYPVGAMVQTTAELNLREGPSTDSAPVVVLPEGTRLQVTGEFQEAGQCDWWPVTVVDTGQAGFVIEQYLKPAPA